MKITYFITGIGLSGGPMILYNFMNGLVKKGHEVFVVTLNDSFQWDFNTYKKYVNKKYPEKEWQLFYYKIIYYLNKLLKMCGFQKKFGKDKIVSITERLVKNYNKLGAESDVFIATYPYTANAACELGYGKKVVLHNQHFEELMFPDERTRAGIQMLTRMVPNHIVNCLWLDKMFQYNYGIQGKVITTGMDHTIFNGVLSPKKYLDAKKIKLITYCDVNRKFKGLPQQVSILAKLYEKK